MKKIVFIMMAALVLFSSCEDVKIKVQKIILSSSEISMVKGTTTVLTAKIFPDDAEGGNAVWSADNSNVTVSQDGEITAVSVGESVVTYTVDGLSESCNVTVTADVVLPESVKIVPDKIEVRLGKTAYLEYGILPKNATDKSVTWSSDDEKIVTVTGNGEIKGLSIGNATITVTTGNGKTGTCAVSVTGKVVEDFDFVWSGLELSVGEMEYQYIDYILPEDADDKRLEWSSADESVATVEWLEKEQKAIITAVGEGYTHIWAKAVSNPEIKASTWVQVSENKGILFRFGWDWVLINCEFQHRGEALKSEKDYISFLVDKKGYTDAAALDHVKMLEKYISYKINDEDTKDYLTMTVLADGTEYTATTHSIQQERIGNDIWNYNATYKFDDAPASVKSRFEAQKYTMDGDAGCWFYEVDYDEYDVKVLYTWRAYGKSII